MLILVRVFLAVIKNQDEGQLGEEVTLPGDSPSLGGKLKQGSNV